MKSLGVFTVVFAVVALIAAAPYPADTPGESSAAPVGTAHRAGSPDSRLAPMAITGSSDQCQPSQSDEQEVYPEDFRLAPEETYMEEPFDCGYCPGCAGSLVNHACCFHGNGNYFCVSSCSSGCVGPVLPEPEG